MSNVAAFVGHSFSSDDKPVVDAFLEFFRSFKDTGRDFSWDHALKAEPRELAVKVRQKMDGKNTFIGICTRKDRIIKSDSVRSFRGWYLLPSNQIEWKTSDWILQEIGFAVGRNLKLVLFVENGVRTPGGLVGDVEYIQFDRKNPSGSFVKFMEMFNSIAPSTALGMATGIATELGPETAGPRVSVESDEHQQYEFWPPQPNWDRNNYKHALFFAILGNEEAKIDELVKAYQSTPDGENPDKITSFTAFAELMKIMHGKGGDFLALQSLANSNEKNAEVLQYLARAYSHFQNFAQAAAVYERAASVAKKNNTKLYNLLQATLSQHANNDPLASTRLTDEIRKIYADEPTLELETLKALREIYENSKLHHLEIGVMERSIAINPTDADLRFSLAYQHSEHGSSEVSFYHYLLINPNDRSAMAWNNLGVAYAGFSLPVGAVRAFLKSKGMNETLAMSNLGHRYMEAGFVDEATAELEQAQKFHDYHPNINAGLTRLEQLPKEQADKEAELQERARKISEFMQQFGRALCRPLSTDVVGDWKHPKCNQLAVEVTGSELRATGAYTKRPNALAATLAGVPFGIGVPQHSETIRLSYEGTLQGSAIACRIRVNDGTFTGSILGDISTAIDALMYLSDDGSAWHVMEHPYSKMPLFYSLER